MNTARMRFRRNRWLPLIPLLMVCSFGCAAQAALQPPDGWRAAAGHEALHRFDCAAPPAPFSGTLDFPSKYSGSGKSRDEVNDEADAEYKQLTQPITQMEKGFSGLVEKYMQTGNAEVAQCAVSWLTTWANARGLEGAASNHTGRSMRKWALASLASGYARLEFSSSHPLGAYSEQDAAIRAWLGRIADKVVSEWPQNDPINKINNHYYWAAWAVMAAAVDLDRRDLFDWSTGMYKLFAGQVDNDGDLPNEMARRTRALGYHNYALGPVAMLAAFGKANGVDLAAMGNHALKRVAENTLAGLKAPQLFESRVGAHQDLENIPGDRTKMAWLEAYCYADSCSEEASRELSSLRPVGTYRLGGNLTAAFSGRE